MSTPSDRIEAALVAVADEISRHEVARGRISSPEQLRHIRSALDLMRRQLSTGDLPPADTRLRGLGRVVVDSWPLDSELGRLVIEAERAFLEA